jgi:hypothetical protein
MSKGLFEEDVTNEEEEVNKTPPTPTKETKPKILSNGDNRPNADPAPAAPPADAEKGKVY